MGSRSKVGNVGLQSRLCWNDERGRRQRVVESWRDDDGQPSELTVAQRAGDGGRVGVEMAEERGKGFVVGAARDLGDVGVLKTGDHTLDGECHVVSAVGGDKIATRGGVSYLLSVAGLVIY